MFLLDVVYWKRILEKLRNDLLWYAFDKSFTNLKATTLNHLHFYFKNLLDERDEEAQIVKRKEMNKLENEESHNNGVDGMVLIIYFSRNIIYAWSVTTIRPL